MPVITPGTRSDVGYEMKTRRFSLMALVLASLVSLIVGYLAGQGMETNNDDVLPGGAPTDGVSGNTQSDRD